MLGGPLAGIGVNAQLPGGCGWAPHACHARQGLRASYLNSRLRQDSGAASLEGASHAGGNRSGRRDCRRARSRFIAGAGGVVKAYIVVVPIGSTRMSVPLYLITDPPNPPTVCAFGRAHSDRAHLAAIAVGIMALNGLKLGCPPGIVPLHVDARGDLQRARERVAKELVKHQGRRIMFLVEGDSYEQAFEGEWLHLLPHACGFVGPTRTISFTPEGAPVDSEPVRPGDVKAALEAIKNRVG